MPTVDCGTAEVLFPARQTGRLDHYPSHDNSNAVEVAGNRF